MAKDAVGDPGETTAGATDPAAGRGGSTEPDGAGHGTATLPGGAGHGGSAARVDLPPAAAPTNHGKTSAAWITTWVIVAGGVLCTFGAIFQSTLLIVAGGIVILVGLVIGRIMRAMGLGQGHAMVAPPAENASSPRP